jgi:hypothetical protein
MVVSNSLSQSEAYRPCGGTLVPMTAYFLARSADSTTGVAMRLRVSHLLIATAVLAVSLDILGTVFVAFALLLSTLQLLLMYGIGLTGREPNKKD